MKRSSVTSLKTRAALSILSLLGGLPVFAAGSGQDVPPADYFVGKYEVVGRKPDSSVTYSGTVELRPGKNGSFIMIRQINGQEIQGTARMEDSGVDHGKMLMIRFAENGHDFEGPFLWRGDLDNYPRVSGRIFERGKTKREGVEAWFAVIGWPK